MKYVKSIILKFIIVAVILEAVLIAMTSLTFGQILFISVVVTLFSYFIGDLLILAISNNTISTITNLALTIFIIYMFNFWSNFTSITFAAVLAASIVLAIGDWFFHKYIAKEIYTKMEDEIR